MWKGYRNCEGVAHVGVLCGRGVHHKVVLCERVCTMGGVALWR